VNFNSHMDDVVQLTADLVNICSPGERQGRAYQPPTGRQLASAVNTVVQQVNRHARRLSTATVEALLPAVSTIRAVYDEIDTDDLGRAAATVNTLLDRSSPRPHLAQHDGEPWHLHFHAADAGPVDGWLGPCAVGLATVLGSGYAERLGVCAAPVCDRVFVDTSRNGARRFCCTACQNRVKSAAHRARNP